MDPSNTNHLINESSPYLLQHAHNPVNWHPWGEDALKEAINSSSLIVVSIGYAACHWCHVMEKESFEDDQVALVMNNQYVSIKVDREERPDIDQVYMQAAYLITGGGGWPLNIIALPDGRPVYAGTYFPKEKWIQVLNYFSELHHSQPDLLIKQAEEIQGEMNPALLGPEFNEEALFTQQDIDQLHSGVIRKMDMDKGGMYGAPKFPMPVINEFLLNHHTLYGDENSLKALKMSLEAMSEGGIYDQLGGGFSRYSTDADWKVPHFEKMLYDNAQLISLYSNAFRLGKNKNYGHLIRETIRFIRTEMMSSENGFYSSLDADSEGEEGLYYIWAKEEIDKYAVGDSEMFCDYYNISREGNWLPDKNILFRSRNSDSLLDTGTPSGVILESIRQKLLEARSARVRPGLDDKILTSWNAMMIIGLLDAYRALGDEEFLSLAIENARFLEKNVIHEDYRLSRNYKDGKSSINAFLDDYAFLAEAYIHLYQLSLDEHWLSLSFHLAEYAIRHFYDPTLARFYYTSKDDPSLIFRPAESSDNVIPSSSSKIISVLDTLARIFENKEFGDIVRAVLSTMKPQILKNPAFHSAWGMLVMNQLNPCPEVVILGENAKQFTEQISGYNFPGLIIMGSKKGGTLSHFGYKYIEGRTMIYVCRNGTCHQPVSNVEQALYILLHLFGSNFETPGN